MAKKKLDEFDLKRIYFTEWSKKRLIKYIKASLDNAFQVILLPTSKRAADILIRDIRGKKFTQT